MEFIDLFCGAGGLSLGLKSARLRPVYAVDSDPQCYRTYRRNFRLTEAECRDIESLTADDLLGRVSDTSNFVLAGCPPCQLFSRLHQNLPDDTHVIFSYLKLVAKVKAPYLVFENVPQLTQYSEIWLKFLRTLRRHGYRIWHDVICAADLGVPQARKRLLVIASLNDLPTPVLRRKPHLTVRDAIWDLPDCDSTIPNHESLQLSDVNRKRILKTPHDGGKSRHGGAFSDSYSRMYWERPAPTITTRCVSFSNGRFGHPEFNRALTVREAARLQGFPDSFVFEGGILSAARQVGNAVPPQVGRWLGTQVLRMERLSCK